MRSSEFLRHAESVANAGLPSANPGDIPLTKAGQVASDAAARDYEGPAPDLIVVSPFRRAQETAASFRRRFAIALVEEWPVQKFTYLSPDRCGTSFVADRRPLVEAYWSTATSETNDGSGTESFQDFIARVQTALEKLRKRPERFIMVVCHEMVIKATMWLDTEKSHFMAARALQQFRAFSLTFAIPHLGRCVVR